MNASYYITFSFIFRFRRRILFGTSGMTLPINQVICGDAATVMQSWPADCVDLIITSPPFNVGKPYAASDDCLSSAAYTDFARRFLQECHRSLRNGGRIAIELPGVIKKSAKSKNAYVSLDYAIAMRNIGFFDREWVAWIKMPKGEALGNSTAWGSWRSPSSPYLRDASGFILVMDKGSHKRADKHGQNDITVEEFLKFTSNCWYMTPTQDKIHPAPFPEELPYRLIKLYSWPGDLIVDPMAGTGTVGVVAARLGRQYVCVDISPRYCEIARHRIATEKARLF